MEWGFPVGPGRAGELLGFLLIAFGATLARVFRAVFGEATATGPTHPFIWAFYDAAEKVSQKFNFCKKDKLRKMIPKSINNIRPMSYYK